MSHNFCAPKVHLLPTSALEKETCEIALPFFGIAVDASFKYSLASHDD